MTSSFKYFVALHCPLRTNVLILYNRKCNLHNQIFCLVSLFISKVTIRLNKQKSQKSTVGEHFCHKSNFYELTELLFFSWLSITSYRSSANSWPTENFMECHCTVLNALPTCYINHSLNKTVLYIIKSCQETEIVEIKFLCIDPKERFFNHTIMFFGNK